MPKAAATATCAAAMANRVSVASRLAKWVVMAMAGLMWITCRQTKPALRPAPCESAQGREPRMADVDPLASAVDFPPGGVEHIGGVAANVREVARRQAFDLRNEAQV